MKKSILLLSTILSFNAYSWGFDQGKVKVWENGWHDGSVNKICFELTRTDGSTQYYGVSTATHDESKKRVFSILLAAQVADKQVKVFYHPDAPHPTGPDCAVGNGVYPSRGIQSITVN